MVHAFTAAAKPYHTSKASEPQGALTEMTDTQISAVNDVISICKDAEQGFRGAADAVRNSSLKSVFEQYSAQRGEFARELQAAVERSGEHASHPAGVAGKLHSGWMAVKGAFTGHSEHEILEETERGEDLSMKTYKEALSQDLPQTVRSMIEEQYRQIQQAHNNIRQLRNQTSK
jgi:uncharacterized protein (TIGR02284 family)